MTSYSETLAWLFSRLPMYQRIGKAAYKADLRNTIALSNYLDQPETSFKSIHVAGTNGKGSTSHMLASVLQEAGYKVGLYTSPHLKDFRERIKINGEMIPESSVVDFVNRHRAFFEEQQLSFFEMTVGLAFDHFRKEAVDIVVVEVGLGGRLDSTNIIQPEISVITNIGMDHMQFLGNSLTEIASEKAGIIKQDTPVIIGEATPETKPVFDAVAASKNAPIRYAETATITNLATDLRGNYQQKNSRLALATIHWLKDLGWQISEANMKQGLLKVVENTGLMGRWQQLQEEPLVICDTAHNKEGLVLVLDQLQALPKNKIHIVLGMVADKDVSSILGLFPKVVSYYFCAPQLERALRVEELVEKANELGLVGTAFSSVQKAYEAALKGADNGDVIYVGGSTFVVAEVL